MNSSSTRFVAFAVLVIALATTRSIAEIQILHYFTDNESGHPAYRLVPYESDLIGVTGYFPDATIFRIGYRDAQNVREL